MDRYRLTTHGWIPTSSQLTCIPHHFELLCWFIFISAHGYDDSYRFAEKQQCAVATIDTFPQFNNPRARELAAWASARLIATEIGDQPSTQSALRNLRVIAAVAVEQEAHQLVGRQNA